MNASNGSLHPAESPDFLSRLHDGELSSGEAASFEEHRKRCSRCRESADSYARALSIFRSASPSPAAADLAARILRRVRAQSPSRRPFGVTFGIDVRWAGVCAAALVVVIMAASILDEGPVPSIVLAPARAAEPESVRARLLEREDRPAKPDRRAAPKAPPPAAPVPSRFAGRSDEVGQRQSPASPAPPADGASPVEPKLEAAAPPPAAATAQRSELAKQREEEKVVDQVAPGKSAELAEAPRSRSSNSASGFVAGDAAGGEAGAAAAPSESEVPVRILVRSADDLGGAPAIERGADSAVLAAFRGREFVLVVESGGRVRSAVPSSSIGGPGSLPARPQSAPEARAKDEREDLSAVLSIRFAPGDRPRRLRVRIE